MYTLNKKHPLHSQNSAHNFLHNSAQNCVELDAISFGELAFDTLAFDTLGFDKLAFEHKLPKTLLRNHVLVVVMSYEKCKQFLDLNRLWAILNTEEQHKARKFIQVKHQENYIFARGILRFLLAKYANCLPQDIVFKTNPYGKLFIDKPESNITFNLSHSQDKVIYAITLDKQIGIDVEYIKKNVEACEIAKNFFHTQEYEHLQQLSAINQDLTLLTFFHCWTRKEAFIKAIGLGLSHSLRNFAVHLDDVNTISNTQCQQLNTKTFDDKSWTFFRLELDSDYAFSLVLENYVNDVIQQVVF